MANKQISEIDYCNICKTDVKVILEEYLKEKSIMRANGTLSTKFTKFTRVVCIGCDNMLDEWLTK